MMPTSKSLSLALAVAAWTTSEAFVPGFASTKNAAEIITSSLEYVSPDMTGLTEAALLDTASRMQYLPVSVPLDVHEDGEVDISFVHWPANAQEKKTSVPVILIHGFDSSCLEYRSTFDHLVIKK